MKVLMVSSKCAPFFKTGGLGDVIEALPKALKKMWIRQLYYLIFQIILILKKLDNILQKNVQCLNNIRKRDINRII